MALWIEQFLGDLCDRNGSTTETSDGLRTVMSDQQTIANDDLQTDTREGDGQENESAVASGMRNRGIALHGGRGDGSGCGRSNGRGDHSGRR